MNGLFGWLSALPSTYLLVEWTVGFLILLSHVWIGAGALLQLVVWVEGHENVFRRNRWLLSMVPAVLLLYAANYVREALQTLHWTAALFG